MTELIAHIERKKVYFAIWVTLLCFTALTTGVAFVDLGPFNTIVALCIAVCKATLVVLFFMHVRHSEGLVRVIAIGAIFWLAILIVISISDFATRNRIRTPPWPQNQSPVPHHLIPGPT